MNTDLEVYLGQIAATADEAVVATRRERGLSPDEIDLPGTLSVPPTTGASMPGNRDHRRSHNDESERPQSD